MTERCPLCRGLKEMTFALRCDPVVHQFSDRLICPTGTTVERKTYPCPECSMPQNKIGIAEFRETFAVFDSRGDKRRAAIACELAAKGLLSFLIRQGAVMFEIKDGSQPGTKVVVATIAVVSEDHQNLVENFTASRAKAAVSEVTDDAIKNIRVWGSERSGEHGPINKDTAVGFIIDAAQRFNGGKA